MHFEGVMSGCRHLDFVHEVKNLLVSDMFGMLFMCLFQCSKTSPVKPCRKKLGTCEPPATEQTTVMEPLVVQQHARYPKVLDRLFGGKCNVVLQRWQEVVMESQKSGFIWGICHRQVSGSHSSSGSGHRRGSG